jgi:hypothetical protein
MRNSIILGMVSGLVKLDFAMLVYVLVGVAFYAIAILTTFGHTLWEHSVLGPTLGPAVMIGTTSLAGLGVIVLGYFMILFLGGSSSLSFTRTIAHLTHSKQIIEISKNPHASNKKAMLLDQAHWLYVPGLVFISTIGLGWDVYNGDGPKAGFFQPVLHALDIFSRPTSGVSPILFSRHLIPALVVLTAIGGFIPALVLPYFEKFKITGVNAGPFHTSLLFTEVAALAGLGIILTLVGLFYRSLWLNRAPLPYHFGILTLLGFSIHFSLGMYLGQGKAEAMILDRIRRSESGKLIVLA